MMQDEPVAIFACVSFSFDPYKLERITAVTDDKLETHTELLVSIKEHYDIYLSSRNFDHKRSLIRKIQGCLPQPTNSGSQALGAWLITRLYLCLSHCLPES